MKHNSDDYTFWGLFNDGAEIKTPVKTLAYLIGLVDSPQNAITNLETAKFVLRSLFDVEEQIGDLSELIDAQKKIVPEGFRPQTPVMLTLKWSPISAILQSGWEPISLAREKKGMNCASGIWSVSAFRIHEEATELTTPENLFWYVLQKAAEKAKNETLFLSVIAKPGWSYDDSL